MRPVRTLERSLLGAGSGVGPSSVSAGPAAVDRAVNVADLVREHSRTRADGVALVDVPAGQSLSWADLDVQVDALANGLSALGLVAGQRVAFALANSTSLVVTYLATARAGLVAVPMNPRAATGELIRMLADCGARLVVADSTTITSVRAAVGGLHDALESVQEAVRARSPVPMLAVAGVGTLPGEHTYSDLQVADPRPVVSPADPENLAALLYTSGTAGPSRAAMLSHRALLAGIGQVAAIDPAPTRTDDVVLGLLPLFHVYGLNAVLGQVLATGAGLVLVDRFDAEQTLHIVAAQGVTTIPLAPPVVAAWAGLPALRERLTRVRLVVCGAAPLDGELRALFVETSGTALEEGYGLTEAAPVVTSTLCSGARAADREPDPAGVGGAVPGVEVEVRDAAGHPLLDDPGELWVRGANLFSGYWPDGADAPAADGWWPTGDVGIIDRDGDVVLVDRLGELVLVNGFNVYPGEVEDVVVGLAEAAEVAVVGVPDEITGEAVVAFVVPSEGADVSSRELADAVRARCEQRLARYKWPREVTVVEGLPHSANGKVAKGRLRAQARRALLGLT